MLKLYCLFKKYFVGLKFILIFAAKFNFNHLNCFNMLVDKKGLFKEFDVVVNGKFVAMLIAPYTKFRQGVNEFDFYFGVYNHKYFSMHPKFTLDCYNACGVSEDFRIATEEEKDEFLADCRAFGYDWDTVSNHFHHYKGVPYVLETKRQFLDMKLPRYVPLEKIGGHMVVETLKFDNSDGDMFFILENNYYSHLQTRYDDGAPYDILRYDSDERFVGEHLIYEFSVSGTNGFNNLNDDALIFGDVREPWWYLVDQFFDFSLGYNIDIEPNDYSKLSSDNYSEFGKMMVERRWVDERVIYQLAMEYMQYGWFCRLCGEIANIRRIELEKKKSSQFEL